MRQDLIGLYFEDSEGKTFLYPTTAAYAGGGPVTAPFWPFVNRVTPTAVRVDIAKYIDRVTIPLGPLPFRGLESGVDDFFDVLIPRVEVKNGYELFRAIEESTGFKTEYRRGLYLDGDRVGAFDLDGVTPRELLERAREAYGDLLFTIEPNQF